MKQHVRHIISGVKFSGTIYEGGDNTIKVCMREDSLFKINGDCKGLRISCVEGVLWITQVNDFHDHILISGEKFVINRKGLVIVSAFTDAYVILKTVSSHLNWVKDLASFGFIKNLLRIWDKQLITIFISK